MARAAITRAVGLSLLAALVGLVVFAPDAHAQLAGNVIDTVVSSYQAQVATWQATLNNFARSLFWSLAGIEFCWAVGRLALRNADISEWLAELVNQIMVIGIFYYLVLNSATIAFDIISSFRQAASAAGGAATIKPSDIMNCGINVAMQIFSHMALTEPAKSLLLAISGIVVLACFAIICGYVVLTLIESYVVVGAGCLFVGFGGSRWSRDFAMRTLMYAISVGGKLMVLQLLVSLGVGLMSSWATTFTAADIKEVSVMIMCAIVLLALTLKVPDLIQGLLSGSSLHGAGGLAGAAATVGGAVATVATGGVGLGVAARAAGSLASQQLGASESTTMAGRLGRFASLTGATAANLASAAKDDVGGRLAGTRTNRGSMPFRMGADLTARRIVPPSPPPASAATAASNNSGGNTIRSS